MSIKDLIFYKMQSLGNDYIYIDCIIKNYNIQDLSKYVSMLSNRNFGIGGDGVVFISKKNHQYYMDMYNSDGSYSKVCGNAFRCVAYLLYYLGYSNRYCEIQSQQLQIKAKVLDNDIVKIYLPYQKQDFIKQSITILDKTFEYYYIDIGNPHCVILYKNNLDELDVNLYGQEITKMVDLFCNGVNIEFYQVLESNKLRMRVYERGAGETLSCGSGACAIALVYNYLFNPQSVIEVDSKGGSLYINILENEIELTGLVEIVYKGLINLEKYNEKILGIL